MCWALCWGYRASKWPWFFLPFVLVIQILINMYFQIVDGTGKGNVQILSVMGGLFH